VGSAKNGPHEEYQFTPIDFSAYVTKAKENGSPLAGLLEEHLAVLDHAQDCIAAAGKRLPAMRIIPDGSSPMQAVLELSLQWAGIAVNTFRMENLRAFFVGYLDAYDNGYRAYDEIYGLVYRSWVERLEYHLTRALGAEDPEEAVFEEKEARNTLKIIDRLVEHEQEVCDYFKEELPPLDPKKFDTHDERLCYFEIMFQGSLDSVPDYPLPEGYHFASYQPGDRDAWIEIEKSAKEFNTREEGETIWERFFGQHEDMLPERMFFVENRFGEKVATASAYFDIHGRDTSGDGWLHWVAVKRDEQGKGLSKPLITRVLKQMKELGYSRAKIPTQTTTWLACKIYYDLGFRPIPQNLEHSRAGWKMLKQLAGIGCFET